MRVTAARPRLRLRLRQLLFKLAMDTVIVNVGGGTTCYYTVIANDDENPLPA